MGTDSLLEPPSNGTSMSSVKADGGWHVGPIYPLCTSNTQFEISYLMTLVLRTALVCTDLLRNLLSCL